MFDFDKSREQIAAELARWDGIERRVESTFSHLYSEQFGERRGATTICGQCGRHQSGPMQVPDGAVINWVVCGECKSDAVARLTDTEPRDEYGYPARLGKLPCDSYPVAKAFALAVIAATVLWTVIYLIISGGGGR